MTAEQITTLEAARDFLAARYPKYQTIINHHIEVDPGGVWRSYYIVSIWVDKSLAQSGLCRTINDAVKEATREADSVTPEALERKKQEDYKAYLESAGYTVSKEGGE